MTFRSFKETCWFFLGKKTAHFILNKDKLKEIQKDMKLASFRFTMFDFSNFYNTEVLVVEDICTSKLLFFFIMLH